MVHPRSQLQRRLAVRRQLPPSNGFALPVALGGAMLLLLSSSSLQLMALQSGMQARQLQRRHQVEDVLASAAQQQAAALQASGPCLLTVDLAQWPDAAASCGLTAEQLQALQQGQVGASAYRVTAYRVGGDAAAASAELELQLSSGGERPWRAGYRLALDPAAAGGGLQITGLQELGLRGARS